MAFKVGVLLVGNVAQQARMALGGDTHGYRAEFIQLAKTAEVIDQKIEC